MCVYFMNLHRKCFISESNWNRIGNVRMSNVLMLESSCTLTLQVNCNYAHMRAEQQKWRRPYTATLHCRIIATANGPITISVRYLLFDLATQDS